jgi:hypothetical protein
MIIRFFKGLLFISILTMLVSCAEQMQMIGSLTKTSQAYFGSNGVSVKQIAVPDDERLKKDNSSSYLDVAPYIHEVYRDGDDWVVVLLYVASGGNSLYLTEPTATFDGKKLMLGGILKRDKNEPVCCQSVYAFQFRIPNLSGQMVDKKGINWDAIRWDM